MKENFLSLSSLGKFDPLQTSVSQKDIQLMQISCHKKLLHSVAPYIKGEEIINLLSINLSAVLGKLLDRAGGRKYLLFGVTEFSNIPNKILT